MDLVVWNKYKYIVLYFIVWTDFTVRHASASPHACLSSSTNLLAVNSHHPPEIYRRELAEIEAQSFTTDNATVSARNKNVSNIRWFWLASLITGWAVALTCYVSHSAKYRKSAYMTPPWSWNPWTDFNETWNIWLRPGLHSARQTWLEYLYMGGVGKYAICHIFWFLFFLFCFLHHAYRSHFLTDLDDL